MHARNPGREGAVDTHTDEEAAELEKIFRERLKEESAEITPEESPGPMYEIEMIGFEDEEEDTKSSVESKRSKEARKKKIEK